MTLSFKQKRGLLVAGYIREHEKILKLSNIIPQSINLIIFEFQLLYEKWNTEFSNSKVNINDNGSIAEAKMIHSDDVSRCTFYGSHIVKWGETFIWNLEITNGDFHGGELYIGLIPNKKELLIKNQSIPGWYDEGGYAWSVTMGVFGFDDGDTAWYGCDECDSLKTGDKLQLNFNWKQSSLHYIVNGKDLGNALKSENCKKVTSDENAEFRLAVCAECSISSDTNIAIKIHNDIH